jgi:hypothetical protein
MHPTRQGCDTRVVNQHIDTVVRSDHTLHRRGIGHVDLHGHGTPACLGNQAAGFLGVCEVDIGDDGLHPMGGERTGEDAPESAARASHQRDLACEVEEG